MEKKINRIGFLLTFVILIVGLGTASLVKLYRFYVNDELDYNDWNADLGSQYESQFANSFYNKLGFVNLNAAFRNGLGQQEMNGVVKLNNGYLHVPIDNVSEDEVRQNAEGVIALKQYLDAKDIKLIYVITPYAVSKYDKQLPEGVADIGNEELDVFADLLREENVNVIDLRECLHEDGIDQYRMMFKTDHHWNTRMGFYAFQKITDSLEATLDCQVDPQVKTLDNYNIVNYEKWSLGSRGQRTGQLYSGIDDFELILPKFETDIERDDGERGSFEEVLINYDALKERRLKSKYTYDTTLKYAYNNYHNYNAWNDKTLLLLHDSYGRAVNPYLDIAYANCYRDIGSVSAAKIEEYNPDAVVIYYFAENVLKTGYHSFDLPEKP